MKSIILIRYGEIHLKGKNRPHFEKLLLNALKKAANSEVLKGDGRYYAYDTDPEAPKRIAKVFGVHSLSLALEMEKDMNLLFEQSAKEVRQFMQENALSKVTFKVETKRSDKQYPLSSMEFSAKCGEYILQNVPSASVDVHSPMLRVYVELRQKAYIYSKIIPGLGGMPIGSSGKAALLLSGGIDSPVAGYMTAKRGVFLEAVHFHSFPYTSERAKEKVLSLAKILAEYTGHVNVHVVHFTDIQQAIYEKCPPEYLTLIMRRFMMRIAARIAEDTGARALVTGESIGQVASQTMESLCVTDAVVPMPVFRPLIGMDKLEIIERAQNIGTYETSILPYEDCCTVFVPKHPATKPRLDKIEIAERILDSEALINDALSKTERIRIG